MILTFVLDYPQRVMRLFKHDVPHKHLGKQGHAPSHAADVITEECIT